MFNLLYLLHYYNTKHVIYSIYFFCFTLFNLLDVYYAILGKPGFINKMYFSRMLFICFAIYYNFVGFFLTISKIHEGINLLMVMYHLIFLMDAAVTLSYIKSN